MHMSCEAEFLREPLQRWCFRSFGAHHNQLAIARKLLGLPQEPKRPLQNIQIFVAAVLAYG
ncbi:MAG TPA: hypothetical protein VNX87_20075 [Candidatus Sulfotelmatobacter sp.]|nr:hypothetical protein [Candidatus Sulfotelmatobacter sp.]